jgi:hypothetical protein
VLQFDHLPAGTWFRLARLPVGLTLNDVGVHATVNLPSRSEFERGWRPLSADAVAWMLVVRRRVNRCREKGTGRAPA